MSIVVLMIILLLMGLLTLFSATYYQRTRNGDPFSAVKKQMIGVLLGAAACVFLSRVPYRIYRRKNVILLLLGVFSVVFPILRICLVAERKKRLVREIPLIAFGLLMVLISVLQVEELVFFVCAMIAFGITALYLLWSLLTLKPRLAAYAAWEAEQQAAGHDVSLSDK
jgi:cell division protein FtsW (lipid II flippase)